ncbi:hypothetical protein [Streptomyces echinatus]|uniref:Uncharacterized protein n=1 Tax=Streptomyces echinatus TaxID=67293 RepID=A0A7W9Q2X0_9ACTN|nr:hypothetical protein [Streptomyces echinatus]MBB5932364.1 hypothetical protein [Streptomyces echinatus]
MTGQPLEAAFRFALWVLPGVVFNVAVLVLVLAPTAIRHLVREARIHHGIRQFEQFTHQPATRHSRKEQP